VVIDDTIEDSVNGSTRSLQYNNSDIDDLVAERNESDSDGEGNLRDFIVGDDVIMYDDDKKK
jgi:hypothetical protein